MKQEINKQLFNQIKGALYGVAVGDALGAPVEFLNADQIQRKYGTLTEMIGGGGFDLKPGEITDDTNMTIAVINGILENPENPEENIGKHFIDWYNGKGFWKEIPKDIGTTCKNVIQEVILDTADKKPSLEDWEKASYEAWFFTLKEKPEGNGALMRIVYPALYYSNLDVAKEHTKNIARMTHWSPVSTECCTSYTENIHDLLNSQTDTLNPAAPALIDAMNNQKHNTPTGHCINSYIVALNAVNKHVCFEDTIISVVNQGGDSDTIGAIAGGLAGAKYGYDSIPTRWIDALNNNIKETLDEAAIHAYKQWTKKGEQNEL